MLALASEGSGQCACDLGLDAFPGPCGHMFRQLTEGGRAGGGAKDGEGLGAGQGLRPSGLTGLSSTLAYNSSVPHGGLTALSSAEARGIMGQADSPWSLSKNGLVCRRAVLSAPQGQAGSPWPEKGRGVPGSDSLLLGSLAAGCC